MRQANTTEIELMAAGKVIPQRQTEPQKWTRRALIRELKIGSTDTLYKWEFELHSNLLKLPHSFIVWEYITKQEGNKKIKRPPLDDYQVECLLLLGKLRKTASSNGTIADTVKDNGLMFFELHALYSPLHKTED